MKNFLLSICKNFCLCVVVFVLGIFALAFLETLDGFSQRVFACFLTMSVGGVLCLTLKEIFIFSKKVILKFFMHKSSASADENK